MFAQNRDLISVCLIIFFLLPINQNILDLGGKTIKKIHIRRLGATLKKHSRYR